MAAQGMDLMRESHTREDIRRTKEKKLQELTPIPARETGSLASYHRESDD